MAYKVTTTFSDYGYVDGEFKKVESKRTGTCPTWDDVDVFLACEVSVFGKVKVEIEEVIE